MHQTDTQLAKICLNHISIRDVGSFLMHRRITRSDRHSTKHTLVAVSTRSIYSAVWSQHKAFNTNTHRPSFHLITTKGEAVVNQRFLLLFLVLAGGMETTLDGSHQDRFCNRSHFSPMRSFPSAKVGYVWWEGG